MSINYFPNREREALQRLGVLGFEFLNRKREQQAVRAENINKRAEQVMSAVASGNLDPDAAVVHGAIDELSSLDPQTADIYRGILDHTKSNDVLGWMNKESTNLQNKAAQVAAAGAFIPGMQNFPQPSGQQAFGSVYQGATPAQQQRAAAQLGRQGLSVKQFMPEAPEEQGLPEILKSASPGFRDQEIAKMTGLTPPPAAAPDISSPMELAVRLRRGEISKEDADAWTNAYKEQQAEAIRQRQMFKAGKKAETATKVTPREVDARVRQYIDAAEQEAFSNPNAAKRRGPINVEALRAKVSVQLGFEKLAASPPLAQLATDEYMRRTEAKEDPIAVYDDISKKLKAGTLGR